MNAQTAQQPHARPRPTGAIILYVVGLAAFFLPSFLWPSSPIDPVAIGFNILVFGLTLYAAYRGQTVVAFFNSICLFFVSYPFLLQHAQVVDLSGHGYVKPLSWETASVYAVYLVVITLVATRSSAREEPRLRSYQIGPTWILVAYSFALLAVFITIFGMEPIFFSRLQQYLDNNKPVGTFLFLREALRIAPFWVAYIVAVSSIQKGRSPASLAYLVCFLVALFMCNPVNSARYYSLSGVFIALYPIISYYRLTRWLPVLFPGLMIVVLPVTSYLRYGLENMTWDGIVSIFYSLEFSSLQVLNDGMDYLRNAEWSFGLYSGTALLIFVPRSFWPEKNVGTGQMVGEMASYPIANVGISPHFDAYLDFGVLGVFIMALAIGYLFRRVFVHVNNRPGFGYTKGDMSAVVVGLIPIFVRGDFSVSTIALYSFLMAYFTVRFLTWVSSAATVRATPAYALS